METLHRETVDLGNGVRAELEPDCAVVTTDGITKTFYPRTRQQANRMSIALKKAARRLQAIGATLPDEKGS